MSTLKPVSEALEGQLRDAVRRNGVVVWLDRHRQYEAFAHELAGRKDTAALPVVPFRGSFLEVIETLDGRVDGADPEPLVLYLPGFLREDLRDTPLLEIAAIGTELQRGLDTLVKDAAAGLVPADDVRAFLERPDVDLAAADAWLADRAGGGSPELEELRRQEPVGIVSRLLDGDEALALDAAVLEAHFASTLGVSDAWYAAVKPSERSRRDVGFAAVSWALAVEYVHDLRKTRAPRQATLQPLTKLAAPLVKACGGLAAALRRDDPDRYVALADEVEAQLLDEERRKQDPEDLGQIDTFAFETDAIFDAALQALSELEWDRALEWATVRRRDDAFWVRRDPARRAAWELVDAAARLGRAIGDNRVPRQGLDGLSAGVAWYATRGATVDRARRELEQTVAVGLYPGRVWGYDRVRQVVEDLREAYRAWAIDTGATWDATCRRGGFLPEPELQQRRIFDDVVRPLLDDGERVALFVVDALRFELGQALRETLAASPGTHARLDARLAELPTISSVGMNALAPVWRGAPLRPVLRGEKEIEGFYSAELQVTRPDDRRRTMQERVGGDTCPWLRLDDVLDDEAERLRRRIAQARLVVVHSKEIDEAGHAGAGYDAFERVLRKLEGAWRRLREAGVLRFVFVADHGFLLLDRREVTRQRRGLKGDAPLRWAMERISVDHDGELRVPLAALEYAVDGDQQLVMPAGLAIFDPGDRPTPFVHGGASLQERVIPVLTVQHRTAAGSRSAGYRIALEPVDTPGEMALAGVVEAIAQQGLPFGGAPSVELDLEPVGAPGVSALVRAVEGPGARLVEGTAVVRIGARFVVRFELVGPSDRRVQVRLAHQRGQVQVEPATPPQRFPVRSALEERRANESLPATDDWLDGFEDAGIRKVFELLAAHGDVDEATLTRILGSPRSARRFAASVERHAALAPFGVRVDMTGGKKRYVREGGGG